MKKKFILLPLVGLFLYVTLSSYYYGPANAGLGDRTGAAGGTIGCGGGCHGGGATSSTSVTVQLLSGGSPVTSYVPGNVYTLRITGTNTSSSSLPNFGFQTCIVKLSGAGTTSAVYAGTLATTGLPTNTHVYTGGGAQIFEHYNASFGDGSQPATTLVGTGGSGTTYIESISWTAPAAGTGSVVLYGVINAVNHNMGDDAGDLWNTATPVTICEQASPVTGTLTVCPGSTTSLSDLTTGGAWSSATTAVGTVNSSTGSVTGIASGTTVISYTTSCGAVSATVTVNPLPAVITGVLSVCSGSVTTLSDGTPGGTWSSLTPAVASISGSGTSATVTGVLTTGGTSLISYTLPATGCAATKTVTVNAAPPAITGTLSLCQGAAVALTSDAGGTWSSGSTGVATVSSTGVVTGVVSGGVSPATSVITYTSVSGCAVSATVTVNPLPVAISGAGNVCPGLMITLSDGGGGSWTSGSPGIATVVSGTGVVTGIAISGGTSVITYTLPVTGCSATKTITVNPAPGVISGTTEICAGGTTTLTDAGSGTWTSASPGIATIGATTGLVSGVSPGGGTTLITYALPVTGCAVTTTVTVDAAPATISGVMSICVGAPTTLTDAGGGSWSSSAPGIASVAPSGVVTGVSAGTASITYTLPSGCSTSAVVTVNSTPTVGPITGTPSVCVGGTTALNDVGTGTWSSSNSLIATVGTSGVVTGVSPGTANIFYTIFSGVGCMVSGSITVTVNPAAPAIGGPGHVCTGAAITLTESTSGTWSSNVPGIASVTTPGINSTLTGVSAGTANITYTLLTGCAATEIISVNQSPAAISGPSAVCIGQTMTLADLPAGGTWTSSSTSAAVGGTTGVVTGVVSGTAIITYTSGTCTATKLITINPLPSVISGPAQVCPGATIALVDAGGGTWSSSNANATVGGGTGIVTGVTAGTATITYTLGTGCFQTTTVTINTVPLAVTGPASVCVGQTISLGDLSGAGTWTSSGTSFAMVGTSSGIVTGISAGTATITFTSGATGCNALYPVTVNALSAIAGLTSMCSGSATTLTDATGSGTWTSSNTAIATVGPLTGIVAATGPGTTVISYTLLSGCIATSTINVISAPVAISGPSTVCLGSTITLTDAGGGTWSSGTPGVATIGPSTGIVSPVATGVTTVTYSLGTGCAVNKVITVNAAPTGITGAASVCAGATVVLTDGGGGTWSSSNANASVGTSSGIVTGITAGASIISYATLAGCFATKAITVNPIPSAIGGTLTVCTGATTTLTDGPGGAWSTISGLITVDASTGLVTGISAGVATVKYSFTTTGCNVSAIVTVNASPSAITGTATACVGATTTLADGGGGTWASSNADASVSTTGIVTGVTAGTSVISYTLGTGCFAIRTVTINPQPLGITGALSLCAGTTIALSDLTGSGTWTSLTPATATVAAGTGVVTGIASGTSVISYTLSGTGCAQSVTVTVNPSPGFIAGPPGICIGGTATYTDVGGGSWSSSAPGIATIGSATGIASALATGIAVITYSMTGSGCMRTMTITVHPLPAVIGGPDSVCTGATATLTDGGGGSWTSANLLIATVGSSTGMVTGVATGATTITYTLGTGCVRTISETVNPSPSAITGAESVCAGTTTALLDGTGGGIWSSSGTGTATVGTSGTVTGVAAGTATISYTISFGCSATAVVTVNPLPAAISGSALVCPGATGPLTDAGAGTWLSSNVALATIGASTGIVTGVAPGVDTITYTLATGCMASMPITVNPLPFAGGITGASNLCADSAITLADTVTGGVWSSVITAVATVGTTGIVSGVLAGVDTIKYTVANSCGTAFVSNVLTINPLPEAGTVTGITLVCLGTSATLADTASGGIWSSSNTAVATIGASSGVLATVAPGIATITYSVTNGCGTATATYADSVLALPATDTILGADSVCEGDTLHLGVLTTGGTWAVTNGNATVDGTGMVIGVAAGTDTVKYMITNACGTASAKLLINIRSIADCNVGIKQVSAAGSNFRVYPNPSTGLFTVDMPETTDGATIVITDLLGKTIATRIIADNRAQKVVFDMAHSVPGSYIVKVNAGATIYRQKIVIW